MFNRVDALSDSDPEFDDLPELVDHINDVPAYPVPATPFNGIEVFSGKGNLSTALGKLDIHMDQIELLSGGASHDMSRGDVVAGLVNRCVSHRPWIYGHFAIPCNTYSAARYPRIRFDA
jgi:hypothetical protein